MTGQTYYEVWRKTVRVWPNSQKPVSPPWEDLSPATQDHWRAFAVDLAAQINPYLDADYRAELIKLDPAARRRFLNGEWAVQGTETGRLPSAGQNDSNTPKGDGQEGITSKE